jgi:VCBS repeat protein
MGVAISDVNDDGTPDLLASNFSQNTVGILLNTGSGQFSNLSTVATQAGPAGIVLADLNQDGNLDMVVANLSFNTATVRYGAGTFANHLCTSAGAGPASVALADFGGSGFLSAASANFNGNAVTVVAGNRRSISRHLQFCRQQKHCAQTMLCRFRGFQWRRKTGHCRSKFQRQHCRNSAE